MKISGFSMVKNAGKLYYPLRESILSILPLVDEYIIAVGDNDDDDNTLEIIDSIGSDKIKIVRTVWDKQKYPYGSILAQQTDEAKKHCTGDWLFYLQADEVVHEKDHDLIRKRCEELLNDNEVEGLLFRYIHFWGDYNHAFTNNHAWYRNEIRIVRNNPQIHSWRDAQSFRVIPEFSKERYLSKDGTRKLKVARVDTNIYHYGWVRPPKLMSKKQTYFTDCYNDKSTPTEDLKVISEIDFGAIGKVPEFSESHPAIMSSLIKSFNWGNQLNYTPKKIKGSKTQSHEKIKYRLLTFIEGLFFKDGIFTFKNYNLLKR